MEPSMLSKIKELAAKKNLSYSDEYIEETFYPLLLSQSPEPVLLEMIRLGADKRFWELLQVQEYYENYQSLKIHSKQYSEIELIDLKRKAISAKRNIVNISSMPMNFKNDPYVLLSGYLPDPVKLLRAEETIASAETIIDGYVEMLDFEINLYRQGIPEKASIISKKHSITVSDDDDLHFIRKLFHRSFRYLNSKKLSQPILTDEDYSYFLETITNHILGLPQTGHLRQINYFEPAWMGNFNMRMFLFGFADITDCINHAVYPVDDEELKKKSWKTITGRPPDYQTIKDTQRIKEIEERYQLKKRISATRLNPIFKIMIPSFNTYDDRAFNNSFTINRYRESNNKVGPQDPKVYKNVVMLLDK